MTPVSFATTVCAALIARGVMLADSSAHTLLHAMLKDQFPAVRTAIRQECAAVADRRAKMHADPASAQAAEAAAIADLLRTLPTG